MTIKEYYVSNQNTESYVSKAITADCTILKVIYGYPHPSNSASSTNEELTTFSIIHNGIDLLKKQHSTGAISPTALDAFKGMPLKAGDSFGITLSAECDGREGGGWILLIVQE